jgi:hypothetical protein
MGTARDLERPIPHAPVTSAELLVELSAWQRTLARGGEGRAVQLETVGDAVVVRADVEALRRRHASLELAGDTLRLRRKSGSRMIQLSRFVGSMLIEGGRLTFTFEPRSAQRRREADQPDLDSAAGELSPGISRLLQLASATPLLGALVARLVRALTGVAGQVDERVAAKAVAEPADSLALLRLLEQSEVVEDLRRIDPLAPARLRGISARKRLLELAGGTLSAEKAADALGLTRQAVDKRRRAGKLLAVSIGKRGYRYPAFQFVHGGVLPGLEPILDALGSHDAWMLLSFFVNRSSDLGGESPLAVLHRGDVESPVMAAMAFGDHGAA